MIYILYNPFADNNNGENNVKTMLKSMKKEYQEGILISLKDLDYKEFFSKLHEEDKVILFGGDGTLNRFVNEVYNKYQLPCKFFLHRAGTGNDFAFDNENEFDEEGLLYLNEKIKFLPKIIVKGKEYYFVNGIGYGIDGECCRVADELKAKGKKKINYTSITIKLLLFKYKGPNAHVIVDGKEYNFKKTILAASMFGRYYGGGMKVAPMQDRNSKLLTFCGFTCKRGKIGTLIIFPSIFKGEHIKYTDITTLVKGKTIKVEFDKPMALQIDGEVIKDVTSYVATTEY